MRRLWSRSLLYTGCVAKDHLHNKQLTAATRAAACQVQNWPTHKKRCKEGDAEPHYLVKVVHQMYPEKGYKSQSNLNKLDCPVDQAHKGLVHKVDLNAPLVPDCGQGNKAFMLKLQSSPMDFTGQGALLVQNPEKSIACSKNPSVEGSGFV